MKKILATTALASFILASCSKKNVEPKNNSNLQSVNTNEFKYNKDIRVYDDSKNYYMDLNIKSNDKEIFELNIEEVANLKIELVNEGPFIGTTSTLKAAPENNTNQFSRDSTKVNTIIKVQKIYKGSAKAVKLTSKTNRSESSNSARDVWGNSSMVLDIGYCSYYRLYAFNKSLFVNDYYYDNGWKWIQYKTVNTYTTVDFSGVGYLYRMAIIHASMQGLFHFDLLVY